MDYSRCSQPRCLEFELRVAWNYFKYQTIVHILYTFQVKWFYDKYSVWVQCDTINNLKLIVFYIIWGNIVVIMFNILYLFQ